MSNDTPPACPCTATQDPQVVSNPPGLPAISYRVGDFTGFRRALLRPLPGEQAISTWRPASGDLGLQVLQWWAYLADVLTFYSERNANESYLRTATQPASVANLVALLGYVPAPGIAATGTLAARGTAGHPAGPLVIPAGMSLSSTASPGVPSQTFEVDSAASFTGQSNVPVALPPVTTLQLHDDRSPQSVLLAGRVSGVRPGDQLVLVESSFTGKDGSDHWSLITVNALAPAPDPATGAVNTQVGFAAGGWGPTPLQGNPQAPPGSGPSLDSTRYRLLRPTAAAALLNVAALSEPREPPGDEQPIALAPDSKPPAVRQVHLSAAVRAISPGDMVLFDCGAGKPSALAVVTRTSEALWAVPFPRPHGASAGEQPEGAAAVPRPPDIVIAHTVLDLDLASPDSAALLEARAPSALGSVAVRYGLKDVGTIIGVPQAEIRRFPATVAAAYAPPSHGKTAYLQDKTGAGVLVQVHPAGSGKVSIATTGTPPSAVPAPTVLAVPLQLLLSLVSVSRGTTVTGEVLGSGNAALAHQSFTLSKSPLTYHASGNGPVSTLTVSVDQVEWQEVPSFYGQTASARVYVVTRSPDQAVTTVTFGDGLNGARLPSGTGNVAATYRHGSGSASPPAGRLTTISKPQLNLASIQNPVAVSGGADPQAPDDIRTAAPAGVVTFGRAISATDYEQIASRAAGVSRATAYWKFDRTEQRTLVTVYVGDDRAAVAAATAALAGEDPNRQVRPLGASAIDLSLSCTLVVAAGRSRSAAVAAATAAVSASAGGLFSPGRMGIGQRLYRSAIDAALTVPGVVAVHDLKVTGPEQVLGEVLDPGESSYFDLAADKVKIIAVIAHG